MAATDEPLCRCCVDPTRLAGALPALWAPPFLASSRQRALSGTSDARAYDIALASGVRSGSGETVSQGRTSHVSDSRARMAHALRGGASAAVAWPDEMRRPRFTTCSMRASPSRS